MKKKREVVEVCPHCAMENVMEWDVEEYGYVAHCSHCGKKMMLCDECMHSKDNPNMKCDWHKGRYCCFRDKRRKLK